jgi:hypothetical protein
MFFMIPPPRISSCQLCLTFFPLRVLGSNQGLDNDVEPLKLAPVVGAVVLYCTSVFRPQMFVVTLPKVSFLTVL